MPVVSESTGVETMFSVPSAKAPEFNALLHESTEEVIESIFSKSGMQAMFFHLGKATAASDPVNFHNQLQTMLTSGAIVVEKEIIKDLFIKLNYQYSDSERFDFVDSIKAAKQMFAEEASK